MKINFRLIILCTVLFFLTINMQAVCKSQKGFESCKIQSKILDEERELFIAKPSGYDKTKDQYPVLFVLDGDVNFEFTVGIVRYLAYYELVPEMIVIGIPNKSQDHRNRDFTPTKSTTYPEDFPTAGGADLFLSFLQKEVIPFVDNTFRSVQNRVIIGHSLGGLFALHSLIANEDVFSAYVAISPSIWWNNREIFPKFEEFLNQRKALNKKNIFIPGG